ncbi:MAG: hypothetical protein PHV51_00815 [Methanosarcinaceae archaeon]|nr:hypothetical protein [Methanosarcinaceae archaeon]
MKTIFLIIVLMLTANIALATPVSEDVNLTQINVTNIDNILPEEGGFTVSSTEWSHDGQYLLVTCSKSVSRSNSVHKHYLLDINTHTFGEIDYGVKELNSYSIPEASLSPSGDKIYFQISRNAAGNCYIVCNLDGSNLKGIGTDFTDLADIIENLGKIGSQNNLEWSSDSSKIVFDWEKPGNYLKGVYLTNGNGTKVCELRSKAEKPVWYDSNKVFFIANEGTVVLADSDGNLIQTFQPENEDKGYTRFSLSPDREKIIFTSTADNGLFQTYISNADGSNLKKHISYAGGTDFKDFIGSWQPDGSLLLIKQDGDLYIVEGNENNKKRLLYKGNATGPRWFPDGKKILFVENKNRLNSIDVDGTNLSFITNFGLTGSYFWGRFENHKQYSISPSGDVIAFTSALYPTTGELIKNEPVPSTRQNIAAPLFIVNSDGSNLTQVTPTIKGRYDTCGEWSPDGKQFTIESTLFSKDNNLGGNSYLVEFDARNSSSTWKEMPVKEIPGNKEPVTIDQVQSNKQNKEQDSTNTSQGTEYEETGKQSPSFMFLQSLTFIVGSWLMHKSRE